jgi:PAS domain S-box-containing protein
VEDNEDDALLTLRELRKGGFAVEWERVDTRPAMERALTEASWGLVISDHLMPAFSSAGALDLMRKHTPELPFIIVSGAAPEDVVTAAMRQGAHDFISKDNLVRLVPAVQRELKEAALRRDRQQIASRLKASEAGMATLGTAMEQVAEAIAITDLGGTLAYANRAFAVLTGFAADQLQGCGLGGLLGQDLGTAIAGAANGGIWEGRLYLELENLGRREMVATLSPVRDRDQAVASLVMVLRDVTKEAELERQLRQSQKMDALGLLSAGIAHDFNNLLTTILASAELIKCNLPPGSPVLPKAEAIMHAGLCAAGLTKQILSFSRKSDGRRVPLDLSMSVRETLLTLQGTIPANVELVETIEGGIWVESDPAQVQQMVLNLAINGLQAMQPQGGLLLVSLAEEPGDGAGRCALLTVQDTGHGMDAQLQERIFEPFFTTKEDRGGTGLGLAMVHATVTGAKGRIQVQSAPGQGASFRIQLPCTSPQPPAEPDTARVDAARGGESVLFVDDDLMMGFVAKQGLQSLGYRVASFDAPDQALEAFRERPEAYDLVFMDLIMPGLNGIELAQKIQEVRPGIPMVLVTGAASASALSLSAHATFRGIVTKPFTPYDLAEALRKGLQHQPRSRSLADGERAAASGPGRRPTILLAEDSHVTRSMIRSYLEQAGFEVLEARDGLEAWERFSQMPSSHPCDLLLTDVEMPRMDGLELIQLVRNADPSITIGVLTSNEDKETVKRALHLGVNDLLNKPFKREDLVASVKNLLAERSTRLKARRSLETALAVRLAQRSMLATPEQGVPLHTLYEPLTDAGGDVFRSFKCGDGSILFILADVAGHSVLSSYAVAAYLGMLSSYVSECNSLQAQPAEGGGEDCGLPCSEYGCGRYQRIPCDPLPHLALKLNHGIQNGPFAEIPVCALLGRWNPATGKLDLLNAGIPHSLICRKGANAVEPIPINGTPLGVFREAALESARLQLQPGDRLLIGTDGFFEALDPEHGTFQDQAAEHWLTLSGQPLDEALNTICAAARNHARGVMADDLLVVGFEQPAQAAPEEELSLELPSSAAAVDQACGWVAEWLESRGTNWNLRRSRNFDILLAVREALTNAVFHGNANRSDARIVVRCRPGPERKWVWVAVTDQGRGFDPAAVAPPADPLSERGRGLPLIRHSAQELRMEGGTLTMGFLLEESSDDER